MKNRAEVTKFIHQLGEMFKLHPSMENISNSNVYQLRHIDQFRPIDWDRLNANLLDLTFNVIAECRDLYFKTKKSFTRFPDYDERVNTANYPNYRKDVNNTDYLFNVMDLVFGGPLHYDFFDIPLKLGDKSN